MTTEAAYRDWRHDLKPGDWVEVDHIFRHSVLLDYVSEDKTFCSWKGEWVPKPIKCVIRRIHPINDPEIVRLQAEIAELRARLAEHDCEWTDTPPTSEGLYLWRVDYDAEWLDPDCVRVVRENGVLCCYLFSDYRRIEDMKYGQWSSKPIVMPRERKAGE